MALIWLTSLHEAQSQKNFIYPFYYPPIPLDTLHFTHPQVGEKVLRLVKELEKLQQRTIYRYKEDIKFEIDSPQFKLGQWGKERLSPSEIDTLFKMAFEPVQMGDSVVLFLGVYIHVMGPGEFRLFEYNKRFPEGVHVQKGMTENDTDEGYVLFGAEKDTVFLSECRGFVSMYEQVIPDTLEGNSVSFIISFPDSKRKKVDGLPEEGYGILFATFLDNWTVFEVGFEYVILPLANIDCGTEP